MKSSSLAVAAVLAGLGLSAWGQVGDGPVPPLTAPPTIYSSSPPSIAVRPTLPAPSRIAPRPAPFAAGSVPAAGPLSTDGREERRFLREAAAQSRFELDASRLAFSKSGNSAVRSFAASLINHHNTVGLELAHLLNARGLALPMISNEQRKALNQLAKLNGNRFDAVYMQQVGGAQAAVARDYEKASVSIREPQINAWILKTLPTKRYHVTLVERAAPGDAQGARGNRPAVRPAVAKAPVPMPQVQPPPAGLRPVLASGASGVQPVAGAVDSRFSASGTR